MTKKIHKEDRIFTDYSARGEKLKWKIKENGYDFNGYDLDENNIKTSFNLLDVEIEEEDGINEETGELNGNEGILTCSICPGISVKFCPRGYYVKGIWCPIAEVAFAVSTANDNAPIVMYDEV